MNYIATVQREDGGFVITFPDAPGCVTECDSEDELLATATEALNGWLETVLDAGDSLPRPAFTGNGLLVPVDDETATRLARLWV